MEAERRGVAQELRIRGHGRGFADRRIHRDIPGRPDVESPGASAGRRGPFLSRPGANGSGYELARKMGATASFFPVPSAVPPPGQGSALPFPARAAHPRPRRGAARRERPSGKRTRISSSTAYGLSGTAVLESVNACLSPCTVTGGRTRPCPPIWSPS